MVRYKYSARHASGKIMHGNMEAEDVSDFYRKLEQESLLCLEYKTIEVDAQKIKTIYRLKTGDLILFCRKTSTMLASGMRITNCIDILCSSAESPKLVKVYTNIYESIKSGMELSAALRAEGEAFPPLLINMVESGEESGNLDLMFKKLSVYYEKQEKTNAKIKTATTYPKILGALVVVVVLVLFAFVLPALFDTFSDMELPLITKIMIGISTFITSYWYLVICIIAGLIVLPRFFLGMPVIKVTWDKLKLNMPAFGKLVRKIYSARFANTLAILYASGLSLLSALRLSVRVVGNSYIEKALDAVIESVSVGNSLSEALAQQQVFDRMLYSMINIGEETGSLDSILTTTSEYYEQETENAIETMLSLLEPIMLVFMGGVIGLILVSVMMPIYQFYGEIG